MSWLFSAALVAEFSAANSWAGAPCARLNLVPTAAEWTALPRSEMGKSRNVLLKPGKS